MAQLSAADLRPHLSIESTSLDALIDDYIVAAEGWVQEYLRRDLDTEFGAAAGSWPAPLLQALRVIVAHMFEHRSAAMSDEDPIAMTVKDMLAPFRNLSGNGPIAATAAAS